MRSSVAVLVIVVAGLIPLAGCGGSTEPTTVESSAIETFIDENPEAIAHQEEVEQRTENAGDE